MSIFSRVTFIKTSFWGAVLLLCAPCLADDFNLSDLSFDVGHGQKLVMPAVSVKGSNLTAAQITRVLDPKTSDQDRLTLIQTLAAREIDIPAITLSGGDSFIVQSVQVKNIAQGKFSLFSIAGIDGTQTNNNEKIFYKSGAWVVEQGDLNSVLNALQNGHIENAVVHLSKISIANLRITHPTFEGPKGAATGDDVLTLEAASGQADYDGDVPLTSVFEMTNLQFIPSASTKLAASMLDFGYDRVTMSLKAKATYNPKAQTYRLDDLTLSGVQAGSLGVTSMMMRISPDLFMGSNAAMSALVQGQIDSLAVHYEDAGLFEKSLKAAAREQNKSPDALRREWIGMANQIIPLVVMGDPVGIKIAQAVSSFMTKPSRFDVTLKARGGPIAFMDLPALSDPSSFLARIEVDAQASAP